MNKLLGECRQQCNWQTRTYFCIQHKFPDELARKRYVDIQTLLSYARKAHKLQLQQQWWKQNQQQPPPENILINFLQLNIALMPLEIVVREWCALSHRNIISSAFFVNFRRWFLNSMRCRKKAANIKMNKLRIKGKRTHIAKTSSQIALRSE